MNNLRVDQYTRNFLSPSSLAVPGNSAISEFTIEDPTYVTFYIQFLFIPVESFTGLTAGLLLPRNNPLSACNYLDRIDESGRADLLEMFISDLQKISTQFPWYFQTLSGLQKFTQINLQDSIAIKQDEDYIEIECLESVDMRIAKMFDLYRKATYDTINRRDMLPDNLRQFNYKVHVTEFRQFQTFTLGSPTQASPLQQVFNGLQDVQNIASGINAIKSGGVNGILNGGSILDNALNNLNPLQQAAANVVMLDNFVTVCTFNLYRCAFVMDDFYPYLNEMTATAADAPITQKFKISAQAVTETNTYPISKIVLADQISLCQYPNATKTIPPFNLGFGYSTAPSIVKQQQGNAVTSILNAIFPLTDNASSTSQYAAIEQNALAQQNIYDNPGGNVFDQLASTYNQFTSSLEQKFQQLGIRSLTSAVDEAVNGLSNGFSSTMIGNIFGFDPGLPQYTSVPNDTQDVELTSNVESFTPSQNIDLTGSANYSIADIELTGQADNDKVSNINLASNVEPFSDKNLSFTSAHDNFTPSDINLTGNAPTDKISPISLTDADVPLKISPIGLSGTDDGFKMVSIGDLTSNADKFAILETPLTSNPVIDGINPIQLDSTKNSGSIGTINLDGAKNNSDIGKINLDSEVSNSPIKDITLTTQALKSKLMAQNIFARYKNQPSKIEPVTLDGNTPTSAIAPITEASIGDNSVITPINLTGNAVSDKIENVNLTSNTDKFKIQDIDLQTSQSVPVIVPISADSQPYYPKIQDPGAEETSNETNYNVTPKNILEP